MKNVSNFCLVIVLTLIFAWANEASTDDTTVPSTPLNNSSTTLNPGRFNENETTTTTPPTTTTSTTTTTTPTTTTTSATTTTTTTPKSTTTSATTTTGTTTASSTAKTTPGPLTTTAVPSHKSGGFGWGPFFAGIVFTAGVSSVAYIVWRFYKARTERNYHTL